MYESVRGSNNKLLQVYDCCDSVVIAIHNNGILNSVQFDSIEKIDTLIEHLETAKEFLKIHGKN